MLARDIYCRLFSGVLRLKYSGQIFMIVAFLSAARGKSRGQFLSSLSQCSTTLLTERDRSERNPSIYHRGFFSIVAQGRNVRKFVGVSSAVPCFRSHRVPHLEIHSIYREADPGELRSNLSSLLFRLWIATRAICKSLTSFLYTARTPMLRIFE